MVASSPSRLQQNWLETTPMENNAIQQPMVTTPQSTRCPHPTKSGCPYPKGPKVLLAAFSSDHGTSESSPHPLSLERCDSGTSARSKRATCDLVHFDNPEPFSLRFEYLNSIGTFRPLKRAAQLLNGAGLRAWGCNDAQGMPHLTVRIQHRYAHMCIYIY